MILEYAIMGFLRFQPATGYDLKKLLDQSIRHFWAADQSQIYRTINLLAEKGWVEVERVAQNDRPDRKLVHLTETGRVELIKWLEGPFPSEEPRSAPLVQVFFTGALPDESIQSRFEQVSDLFRAHLAQYAQVDEIMQSFIQQLSSLRDAYFWQKTLDLGKRIAQVQMEWAEEIARDAQTHTIPATEIQNKEILS